MTPAKNVSLARALVPSQFASHGTPSTRSFQARNPATGQPIGPQIEVSTPQDACAAAMAAWSAYHGLLDMDADTRATMLETIADAIHGLGDDLVKLAVAETGFSAVRIVAERERLMLTLRMFADVVRSRALVRPSLDTAEPSRRPLPKPDMRRYRRGIGPVVVLGPANQPLTGGALGADAVSALAAGCPIICKSHPEHPLTDAMVARVAMEACRHLGAPPGIVTLLHSDEAGQDELLRVLVGHPCVRGVALTGSRASADAIAGMVSTASPGTRLSASIGTINPVFVLPGALEANAGVIAERLFQSCTNVGGQTCTRPSVVVVQRGAQGETFSRQLASLFDQMPAAKVRGPRLRRRFLDEVGRCLDTAGVRLEGGSFHAGEVEPGKAAVLPGCLLRCSADTFAREPILHEEVFGPSMLLVVADDPTQVLTVASAIGGALTGSIWMGPTDGNVGRRLSTILEHRVGRLVFNATPTGLELCPSLVHGGPYPASMGVDGTSVGPDSAERWMRDVSFQNAPEAVLPKELRTGNPLEIPRLVNGVRVEPGIDAKASDGPATEPQSPDAPAKAGTKAA
ncbi:MAG: aldehyde dehydrogenase family protein [Phycisphaeraceae bacterium]|nr:aldehyde dehydrogenase family protein [Phycisphaeraceae bacterium]